MSGVVTGIEDLQRRFAELMAHGKEAYLQIGRGLHADKEVEAIVERFRDGEERTALQDFISELENLFEIISPDPFLRPYIDDYDRLMRIYAIVREAFNPGLDVDRSFLRKTAHLVQEHTTAAPPGPATTIYELTDEAVDDLVSSDAPETVKVINLVKLLHDVAAKERDEKPFLISIGERAEALAEAFRDRQLSTEDALESLTRLSEETLEAEKAQAATGLPPDAFAALWYLRGRGIAEEEAETVARVAAETFEDCPEWRLRSDQEREVRLKLHAALIRVGERNGTADYVEDIVESLRRSHR